jgi:hypothetical protein
MRLSLHSSRAAPRRRVSWAVVDQAVSSAGNFAVALFAAHQLTPAQFGALGIALMIYSLSVGVCRGFVSEPLVVIYAARPVDDWRQPARQALGAAIGFGVCVSLPMLIMMSLFPSATRSAIAAVAATIPLLLAQDTLRYIFTAQRRPAAAVVNDVVWTGLEVIVMVVIVRFQPTSAGPYVLGWGATGGLAAAVGLLQARLLPDFMNVGGWWRSTRSLGLRFAAEFCTESGSGNLALLIVAAIAGLAGIGAIRAGQLLLGPLNVLFAGISLVALPEAVRALDRSLPRLRSFAPRVSWALVSLTAAWATVAAIVPPAIGERVLGREWVPARTTLAPLTVWLAFAAVGTGARVGLRALGAASASLRTRVLVAPLTLFCVAAGALAGGGIGAAWGFAAARAADAALWWRAYRRECAEQPREITRDDGPLATLPVGQCWAGTSAGASDSMRLEPSRAVAQFSGGCPSLLDVEGEKRSGADGSAL